MAILALLMAVPFERGRGCAVCPTDCPMHATRRAPHMGCHQGGGTPKAPAPADNGACAMRAACGHHGGGDVVAFHAELPLALTGAPVLPRLALAGALAPPHTADGPQPPDRPPESRVV